MPRTKKQSKKRQQCQKSLQIDLHGCSKVQAQDRLENSISDCFMKGIKKLIVIHGIGTGAVRQTVMEYLNNSDLNLSYTKDPLNAGQLVIHLE